MCSFRLFSYTEYLEVILGVIGNSRQRAVFVSLAIQKIVVVIVRDAVFASLGMQINV